MIVGIFALIAAIFALAEALAPNGGKIMWVAVAVLTLVSALDNAHYASHSLVKQPSPFVGVELRRDPARREDPFYLRQMRQAIYGNTSASVIVLPEATFLAVSPLTNFFFVNEFKYLTDTNRVLIAGGIVLGPGEQYRNGFLLRGEQVGFVEQRVPVPVAMWKPFTNGGAPLRLSAPSTLNIHGVKTAVLVCYEMVIPWTAITALSEGPQELVGIANDDWTAEAPTVVTLQRTNLEGWARLAGIDSAFAANLPLETK